MFIKYLDFLSPKLTWYYNKKKSHKSVVSGLLSLITIIIGITFFVLFLEEFLNKRNPTAYFYNQYADESGQFPLNSDQIFHYFTMQDAVIDPQILSIIGINEKLVQYTPDPNPEHYAHWIYGQCTNENSYTKFPEWRLRDFDTSYCISKYYNNITREIIDTTNPGFIYPNISKDSSNDNLIQYGIIWQKCKNNTWNNNNCKSDQEINDYLNVNYGVELKFIDHEMDITNYKNPIKAQLYSVSNGVFNNTYTVNHLNFRPAHVLSHTGVIFDYLETIISYKFDQNEKIIYDNTGEDIICSYYFWVHNHVEIYERNYKRIQDVMGSWGGSLDIVILVATTVNYWYNQFIAWNDVNVILDKIQFYHRINIFGEGDSNKNVINSSKSNAYVFSNNNNNLNINSNNTYLQSIMSNHKIHWSETNNNHPSCSVKRHDLNDPKRFIPLSNWGQNNKINLHLNEGRRKRTWAETNYYIGINWIYNLSDMKKNKHISFVAFIKWLLPCDDGQKGKNVLKIKWLNDYYRTVISEEEIFCLKYEVFKIKEELMAKGNNEINKCFVKRKWTTPNKKYNNESIDRQWKSKE